MIAIVVVRAAALVLVAVLALALARAVPLPGYNDPLPGFSLPVVEILRPQNGERLADTDVRIGIVARPELLRGGLHDPRVCLSMQTTFTPADIVREGSEPPSELPETCFDEGQNYSTIDLNGLVPGLSYGVTVGFENRGRIVAMSSRTFSVGSVRLPGGSRRVSVTEALDVGAHLQQTNRAQAAADIYRDVLGQFPSHAHAHHSLGVALYEMKAEEEALAYLFRAVQLNESNANFHSSLGTGLQSAGQSEEAIQHFQRALELSPACLQAAVSLGDALHVSGEWEEALDAYRHAIRLGSQSKSPEGYASVYPPAMYAKDATSRMCELLRLTEGWYQADRCLKEAMETWPGEPMFRHDRGNILLSVGQFEMALMEFQKAVKMGYIEANVSVADALEALGETQASIAAYKAILSSFDQDKAVPRTRVKIMRATVLPRILPASQTEIDVFRANLEGRLDSLLANVTSLERDDLDLIRLPFSTGVPMNSHNRNNRNIKAKLGKLYQELLHNQDIVREGYVTSYPMSPRTFVQGRTENSTGPPTTIPIGTRRLRVGFVSRFVFNSAVGLYIDELIPQLDANKYEIVVFAVGQRRSMRKVEAVPQVADYVVSLPRDLRLVREQVKAWNLDVLVYPELGMDKTTYFLSFSRLAPIQATWWGNAETSGVPAIDYFLSSEYEHPGAEKRYTEKMFPLKGMGIFHNLTELPQRTVNRSQIRQSIQERFGIDDDSFRLYLCIESILHIHPDFDLAIHKLFETDEHAHLFLLSASSRKRWKDTLASRMNSKVTEGRVHFFVDIDVKQELLLLVTADAVIASLHMTRPRAALQAFSAGVPVVAFPGKQWASRITYGFYQEMGITDLIATSIDDYVALAHKLAVNASFHDFMVHEVKNRRAALANSQLAVKEWERFLDFAGAQIYYTSENDGESDEVKDDGGWQEYAGGI